MLPAALACDTSNPLDWRFGDSIEIYPLVDVR